MTKKRLLLIEDDYDVAEMLLMYFASHQYEVLHADNGHAGVELARSRFPNLILLDVMLPDMDGYEVCQRIRQNSFTKYIPVIFLTQRDERANRVRGLELGADDYITKPFDVDELRLRVQGSIKRATRESLQESRTGLPTGTLVGEELMRREFNDEKFHSLRFTLSHFDEYRDVYGFMAADEIITFVGKVLQQVIGQHGTADDFIGILDNQFVVLTYVEDPTTIKQTAQQAFAGEVNTFYTFSDVEQGGVMVNDSGQGKKLMPLMALQVS